MREIKFRVWDTKAKMFVPQAHLMNVQTGEISEVPDRFVLMQYTGAKDKMGREIYEGDILGREEKDDFYSESYVDTCEVKWHRCAWYVDFWGNENMLLDDYDASTGTVIGNIHENPELRA